MPRKGALLNDLTGRRFGRLVVVAFSHRARRSAQWTCACDCGAMVVADGGNLSQGSTSSCGCLRAEMRAAKNLKHGHAQREGSPEYESWCAMRARVSATSGRRFRDYKARGITACERWSSFENFLADMGPRPPGTSLDRINNDGNYEPGNCRWATASQQNANKRKPKKTSEAA